jgi:hypothetical protein
MPLEPSSSRISTFTIQVDGSWDIEDLLALSEAFSESYGYFYPLVVTDEEAGKRIHDLIQKRFWSGEVETRRFGKVLYGMIPDGDSLKLKSFNYASSGALTVMGILSALWMAARVARAWAATGSDLIDLWAKVDKFFDRRKKLKRPTRSVSLDAEMSRDVDDARDLVFAVGERLGFDALSVERLIDITGNPITALKYMVALGSEARKLSTLEQEGLLTLPTPPAGPMALGRAPPRARRTGVQVETVKRRSAKKGS